MQTYVYVRRATFINLLVRRKRMKASTSSGGHSMEEWRKLIRKVREPNEQVINDVGQKVIVWADEEGVLHDVPAGVLCCKRCGAYGVYSSLDDVCQNCGRITSFEVLTPPPFDELWLPYRYPHALFVDLEVEAIAWDVEEFIRKVLVMPEEEHYKILTAWIIASYRQQDWKTAPYLQFIGPVESGKTRALEVLSLLSYRGVLFAVVSPAALCRLIEKYHITPCVDQAEYNFHRKSEQGRENFNIWMCGYRRGQFYTKASKESEEDVIKRNVFSFKALASTRAFDENIATRSITFYMREGIPKVERISDEIIEEAQKLRSHLLYLHLLQKSPFPTETEYAKKLHGRLREIFSPLLSVAKALDYGYDDIFEFALKDKKEKIKELQDSDEGMIVRTIYDMIQDNEGEHGLGGDLVALRLGDIASRLEMSTRTLGWKLKALNIERKKDEKGRYIDLTDKKTLDQLQYLFRKYGYVQDSEQPSEWF